MAAEYLKLRRGDEAGRTSNPLKQFEIAMILDRDKLVINPSSLEDGSKERVIVDSSPWFAGVLYKSTDLFTSGNVLYLVTTEHTSSTSGDSISKSIPLSHTQNSDTALDSGNANEVTASTIKTHLEDTSKHRVINDSGTAATELWSASKISGELGTKEATFSKNTAFNKDFGTGAGTTTEGNDSRLSDSRTCNNSFDNVATARTNLGVDSSSEVDSKISALVDSAPSTLDTLNELSAALADDPNFATTITNQIADGDARLGEYSATATYAQNEAVVSVGIIYISLVNSNTGNTPASSGAQWEVYRPRYQATGVFNSTTGVVVTHNLGSTTHYTSVTISSTGSLTPEDVAAVGTIYVEKGLNADTIYNTGSNATVPFDVVISKG